MEAFADKMKTHNPSLEEFHGSIAVPPHGAGVLRRYRAFAGPALLIGAGYMDPGNWATDLQAGASFGYGLLWVVALASLMALFLQALAVRLGVATGKDLAQACRDWYPGWTRWPNWALAEIAIGACDLAEVLGSAVALNLLFHIPMFWAVLITACDVLLLLALQHFGLRLIEAVILVLVATVGFCYFLELVVLPATRPDFVRIGGAILHPTLSQTGMITLAIGIVGATVMPHNLYLHSALVQSRRIEPTDSARRSAIRYNAIDCAVALTLAFLINAAILILAALVYHGSDGLTVAGVRYIFGADTDWIRVAYLTLAPLLGAAAAGIVFAIALLASGQSSTITGTLAGQVVMEGFMRWRVKPWQRRLVTRLAAIVPAIALIGINGDGNVTNLLVLSQVVLALQLPFAMFPLLHFTSRAKFMGRWKNGPLLLAVGWSSAILIAAMDLYGLPGALAEAWRVAAGG